MPFKTRFLSYFIRHYTQFSNIPNLRPVYRLHTCFRNNVCTFLW